MQNQGSNVPVFTIKDITIFTLAGIVILLLMMLLTNTWSGRALAGPSVTPHQATGPRYVAPIGADDNNSCMNSLNPCATVQHAVDVAEPGDVIKVAAGTYTGINNYDGLAQMVYISKTVTIMGGYATAFVEPPNPDANPTTLDAQGQGRVFYIIGNISSTIEGLRITGGNGTGLPGTPAAKVAGGLYVIDATLSLNYNRLISNTASFGGGLYLANGKGVLDNNRITGNTAAEGGGGVTLDASEVIIRNNTLTDNHAGFWGGALYLYSSVITLSHNTISANSAKFGGGVFPNLARAEFQGDTISANIAEFGGGLFLNDSSATLNNNLITANRADEGGGIFAFHSQKGITLTNAIITDNQAALIGSGVLMLDSSAKLAHTTIGQNNGGDGSGIRVVTSSVVSLINTILVSQTVGITVAAESTATLESTLWHGNGENWAGGGFINTSNDYTGNPAFAGPKNGDYHIGPTSAAIDKGIDAHITVDIDGELRNSPPDLGADEQLATIVSNQIYLPLILK